MPRLLHEVCHAILTIIHAGTMQFNAPILVSTAAVHTLMLCERSVLL